MVVESIGEEEFSLFVECVARGDNLARCMLRDVGGGSPLLMARSCVVRASCANASARSANRLRNNHEVDNCLGGSLCRSGEEDADGLVLAGGGGEGEYKGVF
eukprot:scaffold7614_cov138-Isochrysis_galbana.AAC.1